MRGNDFAHLAVNRKSQQEVVRRDCWGMEVWAIYGKEMGAHRDEDIVHILTPRIHLSVSYYYSYSRSWYPPTHYPQANISTNWGPGQFLCTTLAQLRTVLLTISESGVPEAAQKLSQIEKNPHQQLDTSCAFFCLNGSWWFLLWANHMLLPMNTDFCTRSKFANDIAWEEDKVRIGEIKWKFAWKEISTELKWQTKDFISKTKRFIPPALRDDLTKKTSIFLAVHNSSLGDLVTDWLSLNLCDLTINCDTGQHSQFLRSLIDLASPPHLDEQILRVWHSPS